MTEELDEKRRRVVALLDREGLETLVLRNPANIAWFSGGGRSHILAVQEVGVADLVITRDTVTVVTAVNEAARLESEEFAALNAEFRVVGWDADRLAALPASPTVGTDTPLPLARSVSPQVAALRRSLTAQEVQRYHALGTDAAQALTAALGALQPAMTEYAAAGRAADELLQRGLDPVVLLVAGEQRLLPHRHPLPTGGPLGDLVMVVVCGRRGGLYANLTRYVSFGLPIDVAEDHRRLLAVDVTFARATVPGATVGQAFQTGTAAYAEQGFDPAEWQRHHQGGPTGYETRDELATAASATRIEPAQAFAWNPSAPWVKSEDTILALADGPQVLTADPQWPATDIQGLRRPLILER